MDSQFVQLYHSQIQMVFSNIRKVDAIVRELTSDSNTTDPTARYEGTVKLLTLLQKIVTVNYVLESITGESSPDSNQEHHSGTSIENNETTTFSESAINQEHNLSRSIENNDDIETTTFSESAISPEIVQSISRQFEPNHSTSFTVQAEKEEECMPNNVKLETETILNEQTQAGFLHEIEVTDDRNLEMSPVPDWKNFGKKLAKLFMDPSKSDENPKINLFIDTSKSEENAVSELRQSPMPLATHISVEKDETIPETKEDLICSTDVVELPQNVRRTTAKVLTNKQLEHTIVKPEEILETPPIKTSRIIEENLSDVTAEELTKAPDVKKNSSPTEKNTRKSSKDATKKDKELKCTAVEKLKSAPIYDRSENAMKKYKNINVLPKQFELIPLSPPKNSQESERKKKTVSSEPVVYCLEDDHLKTSMTCRFSHIESPSEFYVQTNQELLNQLTLELNQDINQRSFCCTNNYRSKRETKEAVGGEFGVAFLPAKQAYFRVQIIDWLMEPTDYVEVQLVDWGEKLFCLYQHIRRMPDLFGKIPKLAIKCHFSALSPPPRSETDPNTWPLSSTNALIHISQMKKDRNFLVVYAKKDRDSFGIDLCEEQSDKEESVAEMLIRMGVAVQMGAITTLEPIFEDDDLMEFDNINEAVTGYDARDEARICPHTNSWGGCFKGPRCKLEHVKLSKDGITTDKVFIYKEAFNKVEIPEIGQVAFITITGYLNSCHFYGQFSNLADEESDVKYANLLAEMNSKKQIQTYEPFKIMPAVGEVVLFEHVEGWRRATFLRLGERENEAELFAVDFGTKVISQVKALRQIKEEFLHIPFQAVEVMLSNYREKADVDQKSAYDFFSENIGYVKFQVEIVNSNSPVRIKMYDNTGLEVGQILKIFGFAEERTQDLNPDPECIVQVQN